MLVILGLIGGSFFYGEVVITPAISVMSAIEGLEIAAPSLDPYIVPLSVLVLTVLFCIQKHGTGSIGRLFAPVMVLWFLALAILGGRSILANPQVLYALDPRWAINFFIHYKALAFFPSVPWCCQSPGSRRCMLTWATSVNGRSVSPGFCL